MNRSPSGQGAAALLAVLSLIVGAVVSLAPAAGAQPVPAPISADTFTLTILHNNDGESKLVPDPVDSSPSGVLNSADGFPGVARFVTLMKTMQAQVHDGVGLLTVSAGDNFLASQELGVSLAGGGPLYDSIALRGLYDAITLGNHDFDLGPEVTARFIKGFNETVPFLSANADFSGEPALQALVDSGALGASAIVTTAGQQVGVIGAVTPMLPNISSPRNVVISDVGTAVMDEIEALTAQGVNKIVLVSHLQDVDEERALVGGLTGVDVVVAGGGDELLEGGDSCLPDLEPVGPYPLLVRDAAGVEVPVVTAPGGYRCIGQLTVNFDADGNVTSAFGKSVGVDLGIEPDPKIQAEVVEPLAAAVAEADARAVGTSEVDLDGRKPQVRTGATNLGNLLADALRAAAATRTGRFGTPSPDVGIQNGGGIRNDSVIAAGRITTGDTWDIAPFRNFVVVGEVSREAFLVLLEQAVDRIPGAGGQFPQVSGFTVRYDPSAPARETDRAGDCSLTGNPGSRIRDVTLDDGTAIMRDGTVVPGEPVVVATIDFLANGGDCYPLTGAKFTSLGVTYQRALADYITVGLDGTITAAAYPADGDGRIAAVQDEPEPSTVTVKVVRGDSLWRLARIHLGTGTRWQEIYELNRGRVQADGRSLRNPYLILVGWVLELPAG
jgi:5'-nucleotidase